MSQRKSVKRCTKCGREKVFSQFNEVSEFYAHSRSESGLVIRWQSRCKICSRKDNRVRAGVKNTGKPYKARKRVSAKKQRERAAARHKEQMQTDPEYAARRRESQRLAAADKRRRAGIPPRNLKNGGTYPAIDGYKNTSSFGKDSVDAAPFLAWIDDVIEQRTQKNGFDHAIVGPIDQYVWTKIARAADVSPDALRRVRSTGRVSLHTVDLLTTSLGVPLNHVIEDH